jgi:hypothetical protein
MPGRLTSRKRRTFTTAREEAGDAELTYSRKTCPSKSSAVAFLLGDEDLIGGIFCSGRGPDIQSNQHALFVGQVPNDLSHRLGKLPDKSRHRQNLIAGR